MEIEFQEEPHEYRLAGLRLPSVTEIIRTVLGDRFGRVSEEVLERARIRGRLVHKACEFLDQDELDWEQWQEFDNLRVANGDEPILPFVSSYRWWRDETGFIPIDNEKIVYTPEFAGMMDKKGMLYNKMTIIDLKSGEVREETGLQTAGYAIADNDVACARYGLRLIPGKMAKPVPFDNPMDIIGFKNFLGSYKWMKAHGY